MLMTIPKGWIALEVGSQPQIGDRLWYGGDWCDLDKDDVDDCVGPSEVIIRRQPARKPDLRVADLRRVGFEIPEYIPDRACIPWKAVAYGQGPTPADTDREERLSIYFLRTFKW
jgi:hypothetical protein